MTEPNNDALWDTLDKLVDDRDREVSRLRRDLQSARSSHDMQQRATLAFKAERDKATEAIDAVYLERNQVVAGLAALALKLGYKAGVAQTAIEGWDEAWHGCCYVDLPTGQVSWHFHSSNADLFAFLPHYDGKWDGHDTPEKYRRVLALSSV